MAKPIYRKGVIPAQAETQLKAYFSWVPACAGMTAQMKVSCALLLLAFLGIMVSILYQAHYRITYQFTSSMPEGWYAIEPVTKPIVRNEILVFTPPPKGLSYLEQHKWLHKNTWVMKEAMGIPGDKVCLKDNIVLINGHKIAKTLTFYKPGHLLPKLSLCRKLGFNEYMMMSTHIQRSFDSRYFGPVKKSEIYGRAIKL